MNATVTMDQSASAHASPREGFGRRLDGWKEIAAHLNRSSRCAQRWEKSLNLPVHRIRHLDGFTVYAYVAELEAWRRNRDLTPAFEQNEFIYAAAVSLEPLVASARSSRWTVPFFNLCRAFLGRVPLRLGRS